MSKQILYSEELRSDLDSNISRSYPAPESTGSSIVKHDIEHV